MTGLPGTDVWLELHAVLRDDQFSALDGRREAMLARDELLQPDKADFWP